METNQNLLSTELQVDSVAHTHLKETIMWTKFLAIVGFIISVFIALAALFGSTMLQSMSGGLDVSGVGAIISVVYLVIAAVYFIMSLFLYRFSTKMKAALAAVDQDNFNSSLYNLKMVYRITGIIVIVYLAFMVLALVVGIGATAFRS